MARIKMTQANKNRYVLATAIVAILAAVIGSTWGHILDMDLGPEPDFTLSVDPMQGTVPQSGVLQTKINVAGLFGYDHQVGLISDEQPSDVKVTFAPSFGYTHPGYSSVLTIAVGSELPAGDYPVLIKGMGADGKEHSCKYLMTVKPSRAAIAPVGAAAPVHDNFMVYNDIGIAGGDVWVWSGEDNGFGSPLLVNGSYEEPDAPEGTECFVVMGGQGPGNYIGWGVFPGRFMDHNLIKANTFDLTAYGNLEFYAKTSNNLKVELKQGDENGNTSTPCLISDFGWRSNLPDSWQRIRIPGSSFRNVDMSSIFSPFMITGKGDKIEFFIDDVKWIP